MFIDYKARVLEGHNKGGTTFDAYHAAYLFPGVQMMMMTLLKSWNDATNVNVSLRIDR